MIYGERSNKTLGIEHVPSKYYCTRHNSRFKQDFEAKQQVNDKLWEARGRCTSSIPRPRQMCVLYPTP